MGGLRRTAGGLRRRLLRRLMWPDERAAYDAFRERRRQPMDPAAAWRQTLDLHVAGPPRAQNAVDIFAGDWTSKLPDVGGTELAAGQHRLFEDERIDWLAGRFGIRGMSVLELGPLEGGHTYMLERAGAASILAIEQNRRAYLRCLVTKELYGLTAARFQLGDFMAYLKTGPAPVDLCVALGVLYHLVEPAELIDLAGRVSPRLALWTHYYDEAICPRIPEQARHFAGTFESRYGGFVHTLHRYEYKAALGWSGFSGGAHSHAAWMDRATLLRCLEHFGWRVDAIGYEDPHLPNGPCLMVLATRN